MAAFAETVSGYDSHTEASENSSVGTDVDEGIDPREELYLNESFCRVIFFHNKTSTTRVCGSGANCGRKGHRVKKSKRGPEGFYRALVPIRPSSPPDGDKSTFRSTEDAIDDQDRRRNDNSRLMADLVQSPEFIRSNPTMSEHLDTKPAAISFASPVAPIVPSDPGLAPGSPAQFKHRMILEAVKKQHAMESLQPPDPSTHELQYAHAQIRILEQKAATQEREMNARLQQLEQMAALSLAAKQPPPVIAPVPSPTATVHPSLSAVGGDPDLVTSLFTAAGFSKNSAGDWTKSSAVSPGSVLPRAVVDHSQAFPMDTDPSTGDTHAYGKNVRMDSFKVLEQLCPSGIPKDCLDALGETLPDVAAIPGTYSSAIAEDSDLSDQLGLMLTSVVHGQDMRATYGITRDNQWKSAHRVRLKKVTSEKGFDEMFTAYDELESDALENFKANLANILSRVPYFDEHQVRAYLVDGALTHLATNSLKYYKKLLTTVRELCLTSQKWSFASITLKHYADKLAIIRSGSYSRLTMVLRTYVLLREGFNAYFAVPGILVKQNLHVVRQLQYGSGISGLPDDDTIQTLPTCSWCSKAHLSQSGAKRHCPFKKADPASVAKRLANDVPSHLVGAPWMARAKLIMQEYQEARAPDATNVE